MNVNTLFANDTMRAIASFDGIRVSNFTASIYKRVTFVCFARLCFCAEFRGLTCKRRRASTSRTSAIACGTRQSPTFKCKTTRTSGTVTNRSPTTKSSEDEAFVGDGSRHTKVLQHDALDDSTRVDHDNLLSLLLGPVFRSGQPRSGLETKRNDAHCEDELRCRPPPNKTTQLRHCSQPTPLVQQTRGGTVSRQALQRRRAMTYRRRGGSLHSLHNSRSLRCRHSSRRNRRRRHRSLSLRSRLLDDCSPHCRVDRHRTTPLHLLQGF
jgi:hypothetical protein